jgi:hypothetical protein
MPKTGVQTAFVEKAIAFVVRGRLADSGRHRPFTRIKHQAVGGETLIPNNMPLSVLEFSGIARVSRGHPDNGPAPPYHNVRFTPKNGHAQRRHR